MTAPLLAARALCLDYAARGGRRGAHTRVLSEASFELEAGASLGLVGASGSGKTSLGRLCAGLQRPSAGRVELDGRDLAAPSNAAERLALRRSVQFVFQDPLAALDPRQRALEAVAEPLAIHALGAPRDRRVRAAQALDAVGLGAELWLRFPHELSGGQRQRVCLARALVLEPRLLVLDEPTSALDVSVQAQVLNLLIELRERFGLAYLLIAHDLAVVRQLCEQVAVLEAGRIVELGAREQIYAAPRHAVTRALLDAVPLP